MIPQKQAKGKNDGAGGYALASKLLVEHKLPVLYMYREESDTSSDSGWRFFSGLEAQEYIDDSNNIGIYDISTIAEIDKSITPFLCASSGTAWKRESDKENFRPIWSFDVR